MQNNQILCEKSPDSLKLKINELHLWKVDLNCNDMMIVELQSLLSREERNRAQCFRFVKHRKRFIISRGVLRFLISQYLKLDPRNIDFNIHPYGKPFLIDKTGNLQFQFNLTHSHNLILYGFMLGNELGIDCEYMRSEVHFNRIATRFFTPYEVEKLHKVCHAEKSELFYTIWTRKEAYLKATGKGLFGSLNHFDVISEPGRVICHDQKFHNQNHHSWSIYDVDVGDHYKAAVAVQSETLKVFKYKFSFNYFCKFLG